MPEEIVEPTNSKSNQIIRYAMESFGGLIPGVGGMISATVHAWSEADQERVHEFLKYRQKIHEEQIKEMLQMIQEVTERLNQLKNDVSERTKSSEFQSLLQRIFNNWSDLHSKEKREYVRNLLINAASIEASDDDRIKLFLDWVNQYSDLHFKVIGCIYKHSQGINRGQIWIEIGKRVAREDSADADLYKLLIRDLSTGGIIRQYRQTDYHGNYLIKNVPTKNKKASLTMESAFETSKQYVLTELGTQFVHYAMNEVTTGIEYS